MVTSYGELLVPCSVADAQETGRVLPALGPVQRSSVRRSRGHGAYSNTGFRRDLHIFPAAGPTPSI